jgi:peptidoglycan hydrolase-like protein with peptidoglycan-binding domain
MKWLLAILEVAIGLGLATLAHAAPLTYSNSDQISLSSPAITLIIATGSVADALTVSAASVQITLSSSTGGGFTLTSPSYDLTIASSSGGGTAALSCSSGVATVAISQATGQTIYTITPTASQCTSPSNGGGSGGGGSVSVSSAYGTPNYGVAHPVPISTAPSTSTSVVSSSSLLAEINALKAELAALLAQAGQTPAVSSTVTFNRNLSLWMQGNDVAALQDFLIAQASGQAAQKLKAHGTTKVFGILTYNALKEYQRSVGISPTGYFGPLTRRSITKNNP